MSPRASELAIDADGPAPEPVMHARAVDEGRAAAAISDLLTALGLNPGDPGLADTPARMARMFAELLTPEPVRATTGYATTSPRAASAWSSKPSTCA